MDILYDGIQGVRRSIELVRSIAKTPHGDNGILTTPGNAEGCWKMLPQGFHKIVPLLVWYYLLGFVICKEAFVVHVCPFDKI